MIRILIADDHPIVRRGLKEILDEQPDMTVVAEARNARGALAQARDQELDVVILDMAMPGGSGLDVLGQLTG